MHLICDGFGGDLDALDSVETVRAFLKAAPALLKMTPIDEARVFRYDAAKPVDSGITGGIYIAESHITIHTFPAVRAALVDVCSCKPFDGDTVLELVRETFGFRTIKSQVVPRMLLPSLTQELASS